MRNTLKNSMISSSFLALSLIWVGPALAQDTGAGQGASNQSGAYQLGGFIGFTERNDADFTFGGEFEYLPRGDWSYGAIVEHTADVIFNQDATLLLATANFHPPNASRLKLTGGAGVEFKDYGGDDLRFRAGVGYDLILEGRLTVTPRIAFDFGKGDENVVLGASVFYRF